MPQALSTEIVNSVPSARESTTHRCTTSADDGRTARLRECGYSRWQGVRSLPTRVVRSELVATPSEKEVIDPVVDTDLKNLEEERRQIAAHIAQLQDELSNLNVVDVDGRRLTTVEWHERRRRIKRVYNTRVEALRVVNAQLKERNVAVHTKRKDLKDQLVVAIEERDCARRVLCDFEWDDSGCCSICGNHQMRGHLIGCLMDLALGDTR